MEKAPKSTWIFILIMLSGLVLGGFIGGIANNIPYLKWLDYGGSFGLISPLELDLNIISLKFAMSVRFTIAGIAGMISAIFFYKKI